MIKSKIDLEKYGERLRFVKFTYNPKTKRVFVPSSQISDIRDVPLIRKKINQKIMSIM